MPVAVTLTLAEAATILDPPLTEAQLRELVHALRWKPQAVRRTGRPGHPVAVYPADDLMRLHAALVPFIHSAELV
jgi:hypothetical protein